MSTNLSTVEHYGSGFARSGLPFTPRLNETNRVSEAAVEDQISQVPLHKLPPLLRRELTDPTKPGSNGFGVRAASKVLRAWVQAKRFEGVLIIPDAPFVFPPQQFTVSSKDGTHTIESHPTDAWPQIHIELSHSPKGEPTVRRVQLRPSGN